MYGTILAVSSRQCLPTTTILSASVLFATCRFFSNSCRALSLSTSDLRARAGGGEGGWEKRGTCEGEGPCLCCARPGFANQGLPDSWGHVNRLQVRMMSRYKRRASDRCAIVARQSEGGFTSMTRRFSSLPVAAVGLDDRQKEQVRDVFRMYTGSTRKPIPVEQAVIAARRLGYNAEGLAQGNVQQLSFNDFVREVEVLVNATKQSQRAQIESWFALLTDGESSMSPRTLRKALRKLAGDEPLPFGIGRVTAEDARMVVDLMVHREHIGIVSEEPASLAQFCDFVESWAREEAKDDERTPNLKPPAPATGHASA